jgi:ferrous iron transport protein B
MSIVYAVGGHEEHSMTLRERLRADSSPLVGFCVMLFVLISAPCVATIAMTRQETGSWRCALFQLVALTVLAYVVTPVVFQVGRLLL